MKKFTMRPLVMASLLATCTLSAWATDGYFSHGYGMKAKGMGGAAVASTDSGFAGANNPATAAWSGSRMEAGVDFFMPKRSYNRVGTAPNQAQTALQDVTSGASSDSELFLVPEFSYNKALSAQEAVGITVYGNGGMNTDYPSQAPNPNAFGVAGKLGVDLMQLIIAPTYSRKIDERSSFGISPLLVYQKFKADGLSGFSNFSTASGSVTDKGYDNSSGIGVRLGYLNKVSDVLTLGVSYSPKIKMSKLDNYAGLFAEGGNFDIPENYVLGISYKASPKVTLMADYQRINYGGVPSIGNPSSNFMNCSALAGQAPNASCLGGAQGPGFGWSNVDVIKLGVEWNASNVWTLRAGYNQSTNPIGSSDSTFNILAPGVVKKHYTLGGTYALSSDKEVTFAYSYVAENQVSGPYLLRNTQTLQGTAVDTIRMSQQSLGIQFGWKY